MVPGNVKGGNWGKVGMEGVVRDGIVGKVRLGIGGKLSMRRLPAASRPWIEIRPITISSDETRNLM